jgi:hypothetical protein
VASGGELGGGIPPPISQHLALAQACMPKFAVFFSDGAGFGIEMVQGLDLAHAEDIARSQHPTGRLSAVPAELLDGQDRHKLLAAWLRGER